MKKQLGILAALCLMPWTLRALEFSVAPLYFIDEAAERVEPRNTWQRRLLEELTVQTAGLELQFRPAGSALYNPPQSVGDAIVLCRSEQADYLIYGFITRRDRTIQGELRLLDYAQRDILATFYAMDGKDREDELVQDLAGKLFRYIRETYRVAAIPKPPAFTHVQFPVGLGYWFPAGSSWTPLLTGIFRVDGGVQLIPSDNVFAWQGYAYYFSVGVDISYQLGKGRYYEAWNHSFTASIPLQLHWVFNGRHEAFAGFGFSYSIDLLNVKRPYEDPAVDVYGAAGLLLSGGWIFRLRERLLIFTELRADFRFYQDPMVSLAPSAGVIFRPYTQEVLQKW
jgi:hypothetical protein